MLRQPSTPFISAGRDIYGVSEKAQIMQRQRKLCSERSGIQGWVEALYGIDLSTSLRKVVFENAAEPARTVKDPSNEKAHPT